MREQRIKRIPIKDKIEGFVVFVIIALPVMLLFKKKNPLIKGIIASVAVTFFCSKKPFPILNYEDCKQ